MTALTQVRTRIDQLTTRVAEVVDGFTDRVAEQWSSELEAIRRRPLIHQWLPRALFVAMVVWYFVQFSVLVWKRHEYFGTFDYDLGMYDQGIWLLSQGRGFMTVRGMHVFGHHANLGYLFFVPAYWLGAGPHFLNLMNTLAVTAGAVPLYFLGRRGLRSDWAGLILAGTYLFHFIPQWMIQETFHPENFAAAFLLGAFYFATTGAWRWYWVCTVLALIWKEDVGLYVVMMGVVVYFVFGARRVGVWTTLAGAAWFLFATRAIIPFFSPEGAVFDNLFGALGSTATEVVRNSIAHPTMVGRILGDHGAEQGAIRIIRPYGYVPLGAPHIMLMGLPQHIINFLSAQNFTWNPEAHYVMLPFTSATLAAARTVMTRSRVWLGWVLLGVMVIGVASTQEQGTGPWTDRSRTGIWPTVDTPANADLRRVMKLIPDDAVVSTSYYVVPHLAHRPEIYTFPNPWRSQNFGTKGETRDPGRVDYVLLHRDRLQGPDAVLFDQILNSGDFAVREQVGDLYLLERRRS